MFFKTLQKKLDRTPSKEIELQLFLKIETAKEPFWKTWLNWKGFIGLSTATAVLAALVIFHNGKEKHIQEMMSLMALSSNVSLLSDYPLLAQWEDLPKNTAEWRDLLEGDG